MKNRINEIVDTAVVTVVVGCLVALLLPIVFVAVVAAPLRGEEDK